MIFLTGATGLLGNSIARELLQAGEPVRVLIRPGTSRKPLTGLDADIFAGDLSDSAQLDRAVSGCSAVIHSAAHIQIGWQELARSRDVNVAGTRRIAEAALAHGARMLHVSTVDTLPAARSAAEPIDESGRGGEAKTPCAYVVSKSEAEVVVAELAATHGLDAVILNPGFMLGPYDWKPSSGRMMLKVNAAPLPFAPPGGCSVCDVRDVANAVVRALTNGRTGERYILAGDNVSYQQLWQEMRAAGGRRGRVGMLGPSVKLGGKAIDLANRAFSLPEGDVNGAAIQMACLNHFYSSGRAERELGYKRRPRAETLADAWRWLTAHCN